MSNPNYIKGIRKERKFVNDARAKGLIAFRSAGSHSPIDVCIIDVAARRIHFIQCKTDISDNEKLLMEKNLEELNHIFDADFHVL